MLTVPALEPDPCHQARQRPEGFQLTDQGLDAGTADGGTSSQHHLADPAEADIRSKVDNA